MLVKIVRFACSVWYVTSRMFLIALIGLLWMVVLADGVAVAQRQLLTDDPVPTSSQLFYLPAVFSVTRQEGVPMMTPIPTPVPTTAPTPIPIPTNTPIWPSPDHELLIHLPFDGNARDVSGYGNDGSIYGARLTTDRLGRSDSAYYFDGYDDYIEIVALPGDLSSDFTVAFWEKSRSTKRQTSFALGDTGYDNLDFSFNSEVGLWTYWNGGGYWNIRAGDRNAFTDGIWHHVVFRRKDGTVELYIDSILQGSTTYWDRIGSANRLQVGRDSSGLNAWHGELDDIRVYNRALSTVEIENFAAERALLTLMSPNGGETWQSGTQQWVMWQAQGAIQHVNLEYTIDSGLNWTTIAEQIPVASTSPTAINYYHWTVPETAEPSQWKLRITSATDPNIADESDAPFVSQGPWELITQSAAFYPRDGAGALTFRGKMWLLGGWHPAHSPTTNSEVWYSTDGSDWTLATVAPWEPRHYAGYVVHDDKMWIVGGDSNSGHYINDVWYSSDGVNWFQATSTVPWGNRATHHVLAYDNKIWVMGGQQISPLGTEVYNDVWSSEDGINWRLVIEHAQWAPRGQIGGSAVFDGKMWIIGGGTYNAPRNYYNDVWYSTDGANWIQVVAHASWRPRQYHNVAVYDNKLWVMGGHDESDLNDVWYSSDGLNWYEQPNIAWPPRHAGSVFVYDGALWMVAGFLHNDVWKLVFRGY